MSDLKSKLSYFGKYLPTLVLILMLGLLAARLADLTWKFWPESKTPSSQLPVQATSTANLRRTPPAAVMVTWHLFGTAGASSGKVVPTNAPETNLRLTLKGVYDSSENPSAIIAGPNGAERDYMLGQDVTGGAVLREIYNDRVILERQGRYETLSLRRRLLEKDQLNTNQ